MTHSISMQRYGDWWIERNPKPIPDHSHDIDFWHKDYDGPGDDRHGTAASVEDAIRQIRDMEAEELPNMLASSRYHRTGMPGRNR